MMDKFWWRAENAMKTAPVDNPGIKKPLRTVEVIYRMWRVSWWVLFDAQRESADRVTHVYVGILV